MILNNATKLAHVVRLSRSVVERHHRFVPSSSKIAPPLRFTTPATNNTLLRSFASAVLPAVEEEEESHHNNEEGPASSSSSSLSQQQQHQQQHRLMYDVVPKHDFGQYEEYSVIHTNRSLNIMSDPFGTVMRDLHALLTTTYNNTAADGDGDGDGGGGAVAIIPGSGTFGMESVARQFATNQHVMVLRNGWFSYRWTEIFDMGGIPKSSTVLKARPVVVEKDTKSSSPNNNNNNNDDDNNNNVQQYAPYPLEEVVAKIYEERPSVFFCAHVETSTGMILPDEYLRQVSNAIHDVGGLLVVDCIASGTIWVDMENLGIDVVISAPQKGWTGPCCCAMVMLSDRARTVMMKQEQEVSANNNTNKETSYSLSLHKWTTVMDKYTSNGYMYHTTMPTDALRDFHEISVETLQFGLPELKHAQYELGTQARTALEDRGLISVAAPGYQAPGVLVYYSPSQAIDNIDMMQAFQTAPGALQIAMGVPWAIDEPQGLKTFRLGLFGLDKLHNTERTVTTLTTALDSILTQLSSSSAEDTITATATTSSSLPKAA